MSVRSRIFGHFMVSVPFLNYGGPLGDAASTRSLLEEAIALAADTGADLLEIRCRQPLPAAPELVENIRKVTVVLDLPDDPEIFWKKGIRAKVRNLIRRPMKEGLTVVSGPQELEAFYRVYSRNMRDLGSPALGKPFFEAVVETFPDLAHVTSIYKGRTPVASGIGFDWDGEYEMTWASSIREFNRLAPNMLLYWSCMEAAIRRGNDRFNFGRCSPGSPTHRFKKQWTGSRDQPLPWLYWSPHALRATPNTDDSRLYALATKVWQRLPLAVANRLGPALARRLP